MTAFETIHKTLHPEQRARKCLHLPSLTRESPFPVSENSLCSKKRKKIIDSPRTFRMPTKFFFVADNVTHIGPISCISRRFENKHLTILHKFPVLLFFELIVVHTWSRAFVQLLCLFSLTINNISQFTLSHVLPSRTTTRLLREVSPTQVISQLLLFAIRTSSCIPQSCFRSICIHVEYIPKHGQEMMWVLQDQPMSSMAST